MPQGGEDILDLGECDFLPTAGLGEENRERVELVTVFTTKGLEILCKRSRAPSGFNPMASLCLSFMKPRVS